jgi:hypothetical protein
LADLDRRVLPPLARAFARAGQGGRRSRTLVAVGVAASFAAASIAVYAANRQSEAAPIPGPVVSVGVKSGDSIPAYVAARKAALDDIIKGSRGQASPKSIFALVAFKSYVTPTDLATALRGVQSIYAFLHVPPALIAALRADSSQPTQSISIQAYKLPDDVTNAMLAEANQKQLDVSDYRYMEKTEPPSSQRAKIIAQYRRDALVAYAQVRAYRSLCPCVYAVVVNATPAVLGALAAERNVRVVDAVPTLRSADRAVFVPPLPEQTKIAKPPRGGPDPFPAPVSTR